MSYDTQRPKTVRVMIHVTKQGQVAVGIVTSEWQGAVRVDRRLSRLTPVADGPSRPMGVDPDVWQAHLGLQALIASQATDSDW